MRSVIFTHTFLGVFVLSLLPTLALAADTIKLNLEYPSFGGFNLANNQDLISIIGWLYYAIVTVSGLAAFVMLVWGGIQWMTSSGNPGQVGSAKERMTDALLGLGLVLGSYLILTIINPGLTTLEQPSLGGASETQPATLGCPLNAQDAKDVIITAGFYSSLYRRDYPSLAPHKGIDIGTSIGTKIIAPASGVRVDPNISNEAVEKPGDECNNYLYIKHAAGVYTKYCHLQSFLPASSYAAGQQIATTGTTSGGESANAHLHFQVWKNGKWVDPRVEIDCFKQMGCAQDAGGDWCAQ